ncbi:MAG: Maf family protein [Candidatus Syntrophosphaera sp.]
MIHTILQDKKVVLASASPRRKTLFTMLGLKPLIIPADIHEPITREAPYVQVMRHAKNKALKVASRLDTESIVIGADTMVMLDKEILGKPESNDQAAQFLRLLSGKTHKVYTGICVCWRNQCETRYERSLVRFAPLSDNEIEEYIQTGEPMDKAGAYGIQGHGSQFIQRIQGCYFNVMGFPIRLFYKMIKEMLQGNTSTN